MSTATGNAAPFAPTLDSAAAYLATSSRDGRRAPNRRLLAVVVVPPPPPPPPSPHAPRLMVVARRAPHASTRNSRILILTAQPASDDPSVGWCNTMGHSVFRKANSSGPSSCAGVR